MYDDEPAELCMICKAFGPVNFECAHPDAHVPIANSYQDANGEPRSRDAETKGEKP